MGKTKQIVITGKAARELRDFRKDEGIKTPNKAIKVLLRARDDVISPLGTQALDDF